MTLFASNIGVCSEISEDEAFNLQVQVLNNKQLELIWDIAPNHYLYMKQLSLIDESNASLLYASALPQPKVIKDPVLGEYAVYEKSLKITLPWNPSANLSSLILRYQGCQKDGFCYLPISKLIAIRGHDITVTDTTMQEFPDKFTAHNLASMLEDRFLPITLLIFFGLGILLSFTPCVLPMIPIVVNLIIGPRATSRKAFFLSGCYVLGMALCYTVAGVVAGLLGATLQAWLQQPIILITLSIFLVLLALNQFDLLHISLPSFNTRLHHWGQRQLQGSYIGAFILGILSALIVSPCITPPLIGALTYISQNGNPLVGGLALLCLGLGMGIPLIVVAMLSSMILPKAGEWMNVVKNFAGIAILGLAIWLLQRIIPDYVAVMLWGALCLVAAFIFKAFKLNNHAKTATKALRIFGILLAIFGGALILNTLYMHFIAKTNTSAHVNWQSINTLEELDHSLAKAKAAHKYSLLEFSADWCTSCKRIEATVFSNPKVIHELNSFNLLRVDMTDMNAKQKPLLNKLGIYGPPVIVLFNPDGQEIPQKRVVGEITAQEMLHILQGV